MKRRRDDDEPSSCFARRMTAAPLILALCSTALTTVAIVHTDAQQQSQPSRYLRSIHNNHHRRLDPPRENEKHVTSYAQRHPNRRYYTTGASYSGEFAAYYEDDDAIDSIQRSRHHRSGGTELSDVILCMLTALAWSVWMISSAASSKQAARAQAAGGILTQDEGGVDERFWQRNDALLVHGNVLQVKQIEEQPFPKYRCVIDYVIVSEHTQESLQIRKQFETCRLLEQGFANVELLVLPEEPTHSCLKRDFEEQMENSVDVHSECKRLSTAFAAFLVVASVAGTIQVISLMQEEQRYLGWIVLCVGLTVLFPCAVLIHKIIKLIVAEPGGVIVGRKEHSMTRAAACMTPACLETEIPEVASYVVPEASNCYFVHYAEKKTVDSEAPDDNVSSASTISSISDKSPMTGKILWHESDSS